MLFFDNPISDFCDIYKVYNEDTNNNLQVFIPKIRIHKITMLASNRVLTQHKAIY